MGQMNISIPDELEELFRMTAVKKFGPHRGFLTKAVNEAFREWTEKNQQ